MSAASKRGIELLKLGVPAPAPDDPAKRAELSKLMAGMEAKYGSAKYCKSGEKECRDEVQLKTVMEKSRNYDELLDAWQGWHDQAARPMRADYARFVELANEGARELGYKDLGAMWRSGYDMPAGRVHDGGRAPLEQVKPLYKDLHCYARGKLAQKYGEDKVPAGKPIPGAPARQHVGAAVGRRSTTLLEPYPGVSQPRRRRSAGRRRSTTPVRMAQVGRDVLQVARLPGAAGDVLGALDARAAARPRRAVPRQRVAHGRQGRRAHQDVHQGRRSRSSRTIYHELGHVYYYLWYKEQPSCSRTARTTASTRRSATPSCCR